MLWKKFYNVNVYKKFLCAIQAVINATQGKVGRKRAFFEKAFGKNLDKFHELLWMPETFIIYRNKYADNLTADWREKFFALDAEDRINAEKIIAQNKFSDDVISAVTSENIREVLNFYKKI